MSWFGSRSTTNSSNLDQPSNQINKQKHKQIESLREQIPGVVELKRDERYSVITLVNGVTLTLNIFLPARFPLVGPEITVSPPIEHPWVNGQMVVDGSPLIKNFTVQSKLSRAIEQVIREFQEHPPKLSSTNPLLYPVSPAQGSIPIPGSTFSPTTGASFAPYIFSSVPQSSSRLGAPDSPENRPRKPAPTMPAGRSTDGTERYKCPPIPEKFEEVGKIDTPELTRYLIDSEGTVLVGDFVSKLDVISKVQMDREHLFQDNEDLAAINLGHEPDIQDGWTHLQEKFLEMEGLKEEHDKRLNEQRQLVDRYQQRNVIIQLKTSVNEAETESEVYAEDFLEAKVPVAEFIQKYKQLRKLHHLRKTKYEKLVHH